MIELSFPYRERNIGPMDVRRVLPYSRRRWVGPFVFVDDFGPVEIVHDKKLDVLPHPHIGLATITYLFSGRMTHRDSIGSVQSIEPGEVNLMSAGRGIVHSERVSDIPVVDGERLLGLQTWIALPESKQESAPAFAHHKASELPVMEACGVSAKVILGEAFGVRSPVAAATKMGDPVYAVCGLDDRATLRLPDEVEERSVYILHGALLIDGQRFEAGSMVVFAEGEEAIVKAEGAAKFMLIGGARMPEKRFMWWNFVSTSPDLIEQAKRDWCEQRFAKIPGDAEEFVPLPPDDALHPVPQPL
jgi:redox-sensitive bicupin YhaK (pirin superfamily)